jgi:hypothetical protein
VKSVFGRPLRNLKRRFADVRAVALGLDQFDNLNQTSSSERRFANSFFVQNRLHVPSDVVYRCETILATGDGENALPASTPLLV